MITAIQKSDLSRIVKKMAADKERLKAAIRGNKKALNESTFVNPFALSAS